jgi:hypothetical protein
MENFNEETDNFLKDFFKEIDDINNKMDEFKKIIQKIKQLHSELFNLAIQSKKKSFILLIILIVLKQQLETVMSEAKQKSTEISKCIDSMKKGTEEMTKNAKKNEKGANIRIRETNQFQIIRRFQELLFEYQTGKILIY